MKVSKMLFYLVQTLFHVLFVTLMLNAIFSTEALQFSYNIIRDTLGIIAFFTVIGVSIYQVVEGTKKELMLIKNGA